MRIDRMCVRRLKTTGPYENIAIEICAEISLNDDLHAVYEALLSKISEFIELAPDIERSNALLETLERKRSELRKMVLDVEKSVNELQSTMNELRNVIEQANKLMEEARKGRSLLEKLIRRSTP